MLRKLKQGEQGQALVEMALVLPLFFLLLFGVIEMGRIGYAYLTISNAVREGARTAAIGGSDLDIRNKINNSAANLDAELLIINISPLEDYRQSGQDTTVQVSYPVQLVIPLIGNIVPNPVVVSANLVMRLE